MIRCAVRIRPPLSREAQDYDVLDVSSNLQSVKVTHHGLDEQQEVGTNVFSFDRVFTAFHKQDYVYSNSVAEVVKAFTQGTNCSVFAVGPRKTGKTHLFEGIQTSDESAGMIPRAVNDILEFIAERNVGFRGAQHWLGYSLRLSVLQIAGEQAVDLLRPSNDTIRFVEVPGHPPPTTDVVAANLSQRPITSLYDLDDVFKTINTVAAQFSKADLKVHRLYQFSLCYSEQDGSSIKEPEVISKLAFLEMGGWDKGLAHRPLDPVKMDSRAYATLSGIVKKLHMNRCALSTRTSVGERTPAKGFQSSFRFDRSLAAALSLASTSGRSTGLSHVPYRDSKVMHILRATLNEYSYSLLFLTLSSAESHASISTAILKYMFRLRQCCLTSNGLLSGPSPNVDFEETFRTPVPVPPRSARRSHVDERNLEEPSPRLDYSSRLGSARASRSRNTPIIDSPEPFRGSQRHSPQAEPVEATMRETLFNTPSRMHSSRKVSFAASPTFTPTARPSHNDVASQIVRREVAEGALGDTAAKLVEQCQINQEISQTVDHQAREIRNMRAKIRQASEEISHLEENARREAGLHSDNTMRMAEVVGENQNLQQDLEDAKMQIEPLRRENDQLRESLKELASEHAKKQEGLENEAAEWQSVAERREREADEILRRVERLRPIDTLIGDDEEQGGSPKKVEQRDRVALAASEVLTDLEDNWRRLWDRVDFLETKTRHAVHDVTMAKEDVSVRDLRVKELEAQIESQRSELDLKMKKVLELEEGVLRAEETVVGLQGKLDRSLRYVASLEADIRNLTEKRDEQLAETKRLDKRSTDLSSEIQRMRGTHGNAIQDLQAAKEDVEQKFAAASDDLAAAQKALREAKAEREDLQESTNKAAEAQGMELGKVQRKLLLSEKETKSLSSRLDEVTKRSKEIDEERERAWTVVAEERKEKTRLQGELTSKTAALEVKSKLLEQAEDTGRTTGVEIEDLRGELNRFSNEKESLDAEHKALESKSHDLSVQLEEAIHQGEILTEANFNLKTELDKTSTQLSDEKHEMFLLKHQLGTRESEIEALKTSVESRDADIERLKKQVEALNRRLAEVETDVLNKEQDVTLLRKSMQKADDDLRGVATLVQDREHQIQASRSQINLLKSQLNTSRSRAKELEVKLVDTKSNQERQRDRGNRESRLQDLIKTYGVYTAPFFVYQTRMVAGEDGVHISKDPSSYPIMISPVASPYDNAVILFAFIAAGKMREMILPLAASTSTTSARERAVKRGPR